MEYEKKSNNDYDINSNDSDYENDEDLTAIEEIEHNDDDGTKKIGKKTYDDVNEDDDEFEDDYDLTLMDDEEYDEVTNAHYIEDNINFNENELDNDSNFQYIVPSEHRITSNILTLYEYVELISIRAKQISSDSYVFTDVTGLTDPIEMSKKELIDNKCPLYIKRHIGLDKYELWCPNNMTKPKI